MTLPKKRLLNFEIIRIIAMVLIVFHHAVLYSSFNGVNDNILLFLRHGGKFGVILFVLITGYFECEKEFNIKKILKIILHTIFYSYLFLGIAFIFSDGIGFKTILKYLLPVTYRQYWFITAYVILYLLMPFLNKLINNLEKKEFKKLLFVLSLIVCILPSFVFASFQLQNVDFIIYIYLIGAYIKKYGIFEKISRNKSLILGLGLYLISYFLKVVCEYIGFDLVNYSSLNSIFLYASAIFIFKYFKNLEINKFSKLILFFSKTTLGVYLIHENIFMRNYLWKDLLSKLNINNLLFFIIYIIGIYLICSIIDFIYLKFII